MHMHITGTMIQEDLVPVKDHFFLHIALLYMYMQWPIQKQKKNFYYLITLVIILNMVGNLYM